ncbi:MAG: 30S ribosomal protein S20 [Candidatus Omnitrophica bacterium]|nr:30S ribosomal protein S20 [Candidatus Omnitrophota bacterium]
MPQRRTAKKELRKTVKRRQRNLVTKKKIKTAVKTLKKVVESKKSDDSQESLKNVYKMLDRAASKKVIHPNKAARKKSRLSALLKKTKS